MFEAVQEVEIAPIRRYDCSPHLNHPERIMRKKLQLIPACLLASIFVHQSSLAQPPEMPKPGPEHKRLGYFVGNWTSEGEMKPSDWGPGGKVTSTDKCEWFDGHYAVVCHSEGKCPMGATKSLGITSYSNEEKVYTWYGVDNMGMTMTSVPRGTFAGDTYTYTNEGMMGGKKMKMRVIIKELSPTAYTFTMDTQGADGKWARTMESKYTKVK